jgi:flagellar hook-associated protein 2
LRVGGGQLQQALQKIAQAERRPIESLEARRDLENQKIQLFQKFKDTFSGLNSSIRELTGFNSLKDFKVSLGDGEVLVDVTIDRDKAVTGSYSIEIEETAKRSSMISNGFKNPDAKTLGIGFVMVHAPDGEKFEVFVDHKDSSLNGVARLINGVPNAPIQATTIKDVSDPKEPWRLILTSKEDGFEKGVRFPEFYFLDGKERFWIDDRREAENALVKIDDYPIELEGNSITNFIQGVNLNIKQARKGQPFTLTITEDHEVVSGKIKNMIDEINKVLGFINEQNRVDDRSDTRATFSGDSGLQSIEFRLRNLFHEGFMIGHSNDDRRLVFMHELGVQFNKEGSLDFDENRFNQAVEKDFDGVAQAISGEFGFARQMSEVINGYTRPFDGFLAIREQGLQNRIRQIDRDIENQERLFEQRVSSIQSRFARMEGAMAQMQQQQQQMGAMLGSGGGNVISQLMG